MLTLKKPSLGQFTYLLQFRRPQERIRFAQGDAEVAFGSFGAGQSQQTNLPDAADPSLPRIIFMKDKRQIAISQMAVQLTEVFEGGDLQAQMDSVRRQISSFHQQALEFKKEQEFGSVALVLQVNYVSEASLEQLHEFVYSKFVTLPKLGELASVQLNLGFKIEDLFVNLGASVFEARRLDIQNQPVTPGTPVIFDVSKGKLVSKGVQITLDINDRPLMQKNPSRKIGTPDTVFEAADSILTGTLPGIMGGN